jgi:proteasome assembly chaperone (PAC2) family protein
LNSHLKTVYEPKLVKPLLVIEISGPSDPPGIAARMLIERSSAKPFAEYYSQNFPDHVIVTEDGTCRLPRYEFYESTRSKPNLLVACSDEGIFLDDPEGGYDVMENIIQISSKHRASTIILIDNIQAEPENLIYVAATSKRLAGRLKTPDVNFLADTWLAGPAGILLGLCRLRSIDGLGIFINQTFEDTNERKAEASLNLIQNLFKVKYA